MSKGRKETGEKILLKSVKELQKDSNKDSNKIYQLGICYSTPIFRTHKIRNKNKKKRSKNFKEIPGFIKNKQFRNSMAIKLILKNAKKKGELLYKRLNKEVTASSQNKSNTIQLKTELQKNVLLNKRLFLYYRWN